VCPERFLKKPRISAKNAEMPQPAGIFRVALCSPHKEQTKEDLGRSFEHDFSNPRRGVRAKAGRARGSSVEGALNMADAREVMNIRQASQYLGVSPDTLYKYVNEQKIPAFKLGNRWRFKKSKLDQWMEEKSAEVEADGKKKPKAARAGGSQ
jgi:excisionase family DNA binding protein